MNVTASAVTGIRKSGADDLAVGELTDAEVADALTPPADPSSIDRRIVKDSFGLIEPMAERFVACLHGRLFADNPHLRGLFSAALGGHRDWFFDALTRIVWNLDNPPGMNSYLAELGRGHRKFGVITAHYPAFGAAFMATLRKFLGDAWSAEMHDTWHALLDYVGTVMTSAADEAARDTPRWWLGEVVAHELRATDLAVLTVRPDRPFRYRAGQYASVQCLRWPRVWRTYSIANAPRDDGLLDFHVRAVSGGWVSGALVHHTSPGDVLLLGAAGGSMVTDTPSTRDVLCIAGGTGLSPIKAIVQELIAAGTTSAGNPSRDRRKIELFFGARRESELYDLQALRDMESGYPPLRVTPVVSAEPRFAGARGMLPGVVAERLTPGERDVYVSGPPGMVRETIQMLTALGIPIMNVYSDPTAPD